MNTTQQMGGALGLACSRPSPPRRTDDLLADGASQASALTDGYTLAFAIAAGFVSVAVLLALTILEPVPEMDVEEETVRRRGRGAAARGGLAGLLAAALRRVAGLL